MTRQQLVDTFNQLLADFRTIKILIVRATGLEIPDFVFGDRDSVVLEYGYDMPTPIMDMDVTEDGIRATLSFARTPTPTFVPWESVRELATFGERVRQLPPKKPGLRLV